MIKRLLLLFILLLQLSQLFGQNKPKLIRGIIKDSIHVVADAHIINLNTKKGTISNANGEFEMLASLGEELQITSIQHNSVIVTVSTINLKTKKIEITLEKKVYELEEIVLKKHNLFGFMSLDLKQTPEDIAIAKSKGALDFSMIDFDKTVIQPIDAMDRSKAPDANKLTDPTRRFAGVGGGIGIPDGYSKKLKALRKKIKFKESFPNSLLSNFTPEFFFKQLKIPKDNYHHFLSYCEPMGIEKLYKEEKYLELIKVLQEQAKEYLKIIQKD